MSNTAELKLANLMVTLRESAITANQVADQIEKALMACYEQEGTAQSSSPEGAMPSEPAPRATQEVVHVTIEQKHCNSNIVSLIKGEKFEWDMSPENIIDLKDYCFVEIVAKSDTNVGFKFISSALGKVIITQNYDKEVFDKLDVGRIYVCHNVRKGRKLHWDMAIELKYLTKEQCVSKAKALARIFAEPK